MKKTMTLVIAAAAVAMTFVSCTKELLSEGTITKDGLRTLTVSFASSPTKTTVEGLQPKWSENDEILLADGTNAMETVKVTAENAGKTSFKITTSLTGTITAVYPKSAAATSGNSITGITVSATQDGSFGSANICKATAAATENELTFENLTAVFKVSVPTGAKKLTVTSLKPVGTTGQRTGTPVAIADASATTITVSNGDNNIPNPCYVSVLAPATGAVLLQDLNFDTGSVQGGFSPNYIKGKDKTPSSYAVEVNTMYTLEATSLHAYVIVGEGTAARKWATMNVGATTVATSGETCYGDYYAWGETEPYDSTRTWDETSKKWIFNTWKDGKDNGYSWMSYCGSSSFEEWDPVPYDATTEILNSEYDAATQNWGTGWRMPTSAEFKALYEACGITSNDYKPTDVGTTLPTVQGIYRCTYNSVAGLLFITEANGPHLFFPAAGYGYVTSLQNAGSFCRYWSSSFHDTNDSNAFCLSLSGGRVYPQLSISRCNGLSVRPVSD